MLFKMAWRTLWRARRRTWITSGSVAFGLLFATTFTGIGDYSYTNMIVTGVRMGFGLVTVEPRGYRSSPGLDLRLGDAEAMADRIQGLAGVERALCRITGQAMFASATKSIGGLFFAIHPNQERDEDNLFLRAVVEGSAVMASDSDGIVIGRLMAEKLDLRLGKRIVYTLVDVDGEIVSQVARVRAIFDTGLDAVDGSVALLPIDRVRTTLGYAPGAATMVAVFADDHRMASLLRDRVVGEVEAIDDVEVWTWRQTQRELAGLVQMDRTMNYLLQVLVGLLVAAGVLNTISMSVFERRREFGMMQALGMRPGQIFGLVVIESFGIAVVGLVLGVLVTAPWFLFMANVGIDFGAILGTELEAGGVLIDPVVRMRLFPLSVAMLLLGLFGLTLLAGLMPAWRACRGAPLDAIKDT